MLKTGRRGRDSKAASLLLRVCKGVWSIAYQSTVIVILVIIKTIIDFVTPIIVTLVLVSFPAGNGYRVTGDLSQNGRVLVCRIRFDLRSL